VSPKAKIRSLVVLNAIVDRRCGVVECLRKLPVYTESPGMVGSSVIDSGYFVYAITSRQLADSYEVANFSNLWGREGAGRNTKTGR